MLTSQPPSSPPSPLAGKNINIHQHTFAHCIGCCRQRRRHRRCRCRRYSCEGLYYACVRVCTRGLVFRMIPHISISMSSQTAVRCDAYANANANCAHSLRRCLSAPVHAHFCGQHTDTPPPPVAPLDIQIVCLILLLCACVRERV